MSIYLPESTSPRRTILRNGRWISGSWTRTHYIMGRSIDFDSNSVQVIPSVSSLSLSLPPSLSLSLSLSLPLSLRLPLSPSPSLSVSLSLPPSLLPPSLSPSLPLSPPLSPSPSVSTIWRAMTESQVRSTRGHVRADLRPAYPHASTYLLQRHHLSGPTRQPRLESRAERGERLHEHSKHVDRQFQERTTTGR